jgi:hypothetical protein
MPFYINLHHATPLYITLHPILHQKPHLHFVTSSQLQFYSSQLKKGIIFMSKKHVLIYTTLELICDRLQLLVLGGVLYFIFFT